MLKPELNRPDAGGYPAPSFPSDAEIAFAEQLRHQLEERYLAPPSPPSPSSPFQLPSSEGH